MADGAAELASFAVAHPRSRIVPAQTREARQAARKVGLTVGEGHSHGGRKGRLP
jgi:hypothetical protein